MNELIAQSVVRLSQALIAQKGVLATAESCTGGLVAGSVTALAGSSRWFDQGWITYSNAAKHAQLGVRTETLKYHGAVSEQTAREMAQGVLKHAANATVSIAITGIAGPEGGTPGKPVGYVCFGFGVRTFEGQAHITSVSKVFDGDRNAVRLASVQFALDRALSYLNENT